MSIASAIAAAQQKVANAYTAVSNKGGTLPATQNLSNLPTAINSISGGASAVGYIPKTISGSTVSEGSTLPDFTGIDTIGTRGYYYAFYNNTKIPATINMSTITTIGERGCYYMFNGCSNITTVDLSNLTTVGNSGCYWMFYSCSKLANINLSKLQTIGPSGCAYMFRYCSKLTNITFNKLSSIGSSGCLYRCFGGATTLTSVSFPALTSTSFGNYTDQFNEMLTGVTGCTVHFPSNLQSVIGSWTSVTSGFSGTNTVVSYDLPATS